MAGNKVDLYKNQNQHFSLFLLHLTWLIILKEYNNDDNNLLNMQWDDYSVKICNVYYHFNIMTLVISLVFLSKQT